MLIICPDCATNFSVPDAALGTKGRMVKCAKCGCKWFQQAKPQELEPEPETFQPTPAFAEAVSNYDFDKDKRAASEPTLDEWEDEQASAPKNKPVDFDLDEPEPPRESRELGSLTIDADDRQPIPEMLSEAVADAPPKSGATGLWLLLILLLLCSAGGAAYYFQDKVVEFWPPADKLLVDAGLRREKPGAGLELRNAGTPERVVVNDTDVLIVRGIIANISDRKRTIPPMKLMLLDKDKRVVQEKVDQPPVAALDPAGTSSFRIQLQRPDPSAIEVNVIFIEPETAKSN